MEAVAFSGHALDVLFLLLSGLLVMWMVAGMTLYEVGLVQARSTIDILAKNIAVFAITCVVFTLLGHKLIYVFNGTSSAYLHIIGFTMPGKEKLAELFFQLMLANIAISIVIGATAERIKLWSFLIFALVVASVIYPVQAYWVWGEGFLSHLGFIDVAGAGVVHLTAAAASLAGVLLLGARRGRYDTKGKVQPLPGCNLPLSVLGMFLIWGAFFGVNGGSFLSILSQPNLIAEVFINTNASAASALLAAMILSRIMFGKTDLTLLLNGALAGLVAISASPATPSFTGALGIGAVAGVLVIFAIVLLSKLRIDDPIGAIAVHGIGGIWGLLIAPFSQNYVALSALHGAVWHRSQQLGIQVVGMLSIFTWVFVASFVTLLVIRFAIGLRRHTDEEAIGLDLVDYGMAAYPEFTSSREQ